MWRQQQQRLLVAIVRRSRRCCCHRQLSTTNRPSGDRLRVAVVGGGAAGLSTALHLAPLVSEGLLAGPIDVYDRNGGNVGKEVGVGIWTTALDPFATTSVPSHQLVVDELMHRHGTMIKKVGYRNPRGDWLATSTLENEMNKVNKDSLPGLLFVKESNLLSTLRKAIHLEEQRGTVKLHAGPLYQVGSIDEKCSKPWSASLVMSGNEQNVDDNTVMNYGDAEEISGAAVEPAPVGTKTSERGRLTERDYHLIVASDGMESSLRKLYGGHLTMPVRQLMGTAALSSSPLDLPTDTPSQSGFSDKLKTEWDEIGQAEATETQDRNYTVFRGNSLMTTAESGLENISFQTWGEGKSMRFATVPMVIGKDERLVWFITIENDDTIVSESDPARRRDLVLKAFADWHDPIKAIVERTPPEDIYVERALAHKHCMGPVMNFHKVVELRKRSFAASSSTGLGPAIVYVGDAFMCVDPILAQGITAGMESAAALAGSLRRDNIHVSTTSPISLAFDPMALRHELRIRHSARLGRIVCLLRATELVQALGQPNSGTMTGLISRDVLRPLMKLAPDAIKTPIFNAMLKYSLGLSAFEKHEPLVTKTREV